MLKKVSHLLCICLFVLAFTSQVFGKSSPVITADPEIIKLGESTTLSWNGKSAKSVTIDNGIGNVSKKSYIVVSPKETAVYTITVIDNKGVSSNDSVEVTVIQPKPIVTLSVDSSSIILGKSAILSWKSEYAAKATIDHGVGDIIVNGTISVSPEETATYTITVTGTGGTSSANVTINVIPPAPTVSIKASPETITSGGSSVLSWNSTYASSAAISGIGSVDVNGSVNVSPTETTIYTITVKGLGGTNTANVTVVVNNNESQIPSATINAAPDVIEQGQSAMLSWTTKDAKKIYIDNGIGSVAASGSVSISPVNTTTYVITAINSAGSSSTRVVVKVMGHPQALPDGSFGKNYEDLIPKDATVKAYDSKRFAIITGIVNDINKAPIEGVFVTIYSHPEYGSALTDSTGRFSIPVEGGGVITLVYKKDGFITSHRQVNAPWADFAIAETVQLIAEDTVTTKVTFDGNANTVVAHKSTEIKDEFGSRACTMIFTGDNNAYSVDANGNVIAKLDTIVTRATEFITPESMPAVLPPTSAFTYCAELKVDGVERVKFEKPVVTWVDNFLGFPVGSIVPVGYYDRDRGVWVPSNNGVVVQLLDTDGDGIVDALDANGDSKPDDLNKDGSFSDEVKGLNDPTKYKQGATFWRVEVTHFTPWDCNWPYGPPSGSTSPNPNGGPDADKQQCPDCQTENASFVEDRSRIFHEDIPIPGTDMTLHYASNRVEGYKHKITVPASGSTVPSNLKNIIVNVEVAGRKFEQNLSPLPNQSAEFNWDGADQLGHQVKGSVYAHVNIGFVYGAVYYSPRDFQQSFGQAGDSITGVRARQEIILWKSSKIIIPIVEGNIAKGWSISCHNQYQFDTNILYKGDGSFNSNFNSDIITTIAGNGVYGSGYSGDGGPATQAKISPSYGLAIDNAGNLYFSDGYNYRIRKVDTSGIITTVAGNGVDGYSGDGGPATQAKISTPFDLAIDNAGNLYFSDVKNHRIRKIDTSGIITTVVGNGIDGYSGDGGPAIQAKISWPYALAIDTVGNIYFNDTFCIRKVDVKGIITTVVANRGLYTGDGQHYSGDGGPAIQAEISTPYGLAIDTVGNIYFYDAYNYRIRKIDTSGIITTIAGYGGYGYSGDGGPAIQARLGDPFNLAIDTVGNIFLNSFNRLRKIDTNGIINTIAGIGSYGYNGNGYSGDGGPASNAQFNDIEDLAIDTAGNIYILDMHNYRIRKISHNNILFRFGDIFFSEENGTGHIISSNLLHKKTVDLNTNVTLYDFGYNQSNKLTSITDQFSNQITIQRDNNGVPTAIISPDGKMTKLIIDSNNNLSKIIYPEASFYSFEYTPDGLMTAKIEPKGNRYTHSFDNVGRLTDVGDDEGGTWHYDRTVNNKGEILTKILTADGNLTTYLDYRDSTGFYTSTITSPTGSETLFNQSGDGLTIKKSLPCGMNLTFKKDLDPQYKFMYVKQMTETSPSGLKKDTSYDKIYQDTNSDKIPDLITNKITVNGKTASIVQNTLQSQKTITSPENRKITASYDPVNLLTKNITISGLYDTVYSYDTKGRKTSIGANTKNINFTYDNQGNLASITDPMKNITTYDHDSVGRITAIHNPNGSTIKFSYDKNGNMTILTNPLEVNHGFDFNKVNKPFSYITPSSGSYCYKYNKERELIQTTFPSGKQISNTYDKTNLSQIKTPEGNIDFTYFCNSKVKTVTKGSESIAYEYDGKLLTSKILAGTLNLSLGYTYDNDFNLINFAYAGSTAAYIYDKDGLLIGAGEYAINRDSGNGLPKAVTSSNLNVTRTFNGYGEVEQENFVVSGQNFASWNLKRDDAGRITAKTETAGDIMTFNYAYTYDNMGRLLNVMRDGNIVEEYQYNKNGSRIFEKNALKNIERAMNYSNEDHLLTAGTASYQYDLDGFLTTKTQDSKTTSYKYSSRGELLSVKFPDNKVIEYIHDPLGRRIAKKINGVIVEKYLWQGLTRLLAVLDANNSLSMRFDYADGRMPVSMNAAGVKYYLGYDQVGSLKVVADGSGNLVKIIDYDSFGNIIADSNISFSVPFGFAGGLHDRDTGLVSFGYRDFDTDTGRWTAKDPIGFKGGDTDLWGYVLNDPIGFIDPDGLNPLAGAIEGAEIGGAIGGPVGAIAGAITGTAIGYGIASLLDNLVNDDEPEYPDNPDNAPEKFRPIKGSRGKACPEDGSVWERDQSRHGGPQWKRWLNKKSWERGGKPQSVWPDGRIRK